MTINYKVRDIKGNIYDVEIEKDKTLKDFKEAISDVVQDDNYRCDLLNLVYNQNVLKDNNQTIESIGAEEDACFAITKVATVSINFILSPKQSLSNHNLPLKNFLIDKECTDPKAIVEAVCYQDQDLSTEKVSVFSDCWEKLNGKITVEEGKVFGLYIQEEGITPLFFKNGNRRVLLAFPSGDSLQKCQSDVSKQFGDASLDFFIDNNKLDLNKPVSTYPNFTDITISEKRHFCLLL